MAFNWGKKQVFPAQRDDEDEGVKISRESWDQMQQALGGLAESVKRLERRTSRSSPVVQQPQQPQVPIKPHKPEINFDGLPDPVSDKDGFLREASKRLQTQLDTMVATQQAGAQQQQQTAQQAAAIQNRVNGLWKKWQKSYKQFSKADRVVEVEASRMVQEGLASGMSLDDVMFNDEDGFLEDLAERVGGALQEMGVRVEGQDGRDPNEVAAHVDEGLKRFGNMFKTGDMPDGREPDLAAGDTGSLTPRRKGTDANKPEPLTEQLSKAQEAMGLL